MKLILAKPCMWRMQVAEVAAAAQKGLSAAITGPSIALLESCPDDLWPRLARLLASALRTATQVSPVAWTSKLSFARPKLRSSAPHAQVYSNKVGKSPPGGRWCIAEVLVSVYSPMLYVLSSVTCPGRGRGPARVRAEQCGASGSGRAVKCVRARAPGGARARGRQHRAAPHEGAPGWRLRMKWQQFLNTLHLGIPSL